MAAKTITELDIWTEVIAPDDGDMTPEHARAVLQWRFNPKAKDRMRKLADRNNRGCLTERERYELERYVLVGQVIAVLQAKARLSLKQTGSNGVD